jgi:DNA-binding response OmpR family regulator
MAGERILIVEDERAVARGLEYALASEGFSVLWAETGQQALDLARGRDPHLILLDIRLPDISGFDVCRQLRVEGLELGADDYMVKPYSLRELISRVRALLRRAYGELSAASVGGRLRFGDVEVNMERIQVTRRGQLVELTPTEFRLLRYLISNPERPCSRDELIEAVWGYASDVSSDRTVDVHIRHLRKKLEDDPANPRWLVTVRGVGYKFER